MSVQKVVLVDMDGVLADFDGATLAYLAEHHSEIPLSGRHNFYIREDYEDAAHQAIINELHSSQNFFTNLPPIVGALDGWQRLIDLGYEPRVCSSPLSMHQWCEEEKRAWLRQYFGEDVVRDAYITKHKELCDGIALIDDRPVVKNAEQAPWQHILFDASYNRGETNELRMMGWDDEALSELLARAGEMSEAK